MTTEPQYGKYRLVNKRTGKLASSSTWLRDLAACAVVKRDTAGLPSLLPQQEARKLLVHNKLRRFKPHKAETATVGSESSNAQIRELANNALPTIAAFYIQNVVGNRRPTQVNKKGFRAWIMAELEKPQSPLNVFLKNEPKFSALGDVNRGDKWWRECQKQRVNL